MLIDEVVRTCANESVAQAAVTSIGRNFLAEVTQRAGDDDMSVGAFTARSVSRFLRHGEEAELRSVVEAMKGSQEPVLAGLHRILCIMIASGGWSEDRQRHARVPRIDAQLWAMEAESGRDLRA